MDSLNRFLMDRKESLYSTWGFGKKGKSSSKDKPSNGPSPPLSSSEESTSRPTRRRTVLSVPSSTDEGVLSQKQRREVSFQFPRGGGNPVVDKDVVMKRTSGEFARALFDYEADEVRQLSFRAGDVFKVLRKDKSGWWKVEAGERLGWVPRNYCETLRLDDAERDPPSSPHHRASTPKHRASSIIGVEKQTSRTTTTTRVKKRSHDVPHAPSNKTGQSSHSRGVHSVVHHDKGMQMQDGADTANYDGDTPDECIGRDDGDDGFDDGGDDDDAVVIGRDGDGDPDSTIDSDPCRCRGKYKYDGEVSCMICGLDGPRIDRMQFVHKCSNMDYCRECYKNQGSPGGFISVMYEPLPKELPPKPPSGQRHRKRDTVLDWMWIVFFFAFPFFKTRLDDREPDDVFAGLRHPNLAIRFLNVMMLPLLAAMFMSVYLYKVMINAYRVFYVFTVVSLPMIVAWGWQWYLSCARDTVAWILVGHSEESL